MDVALVVAGNSFVGRHLGRRLDALRVPFHATSRDRRPGMLRCDLTRPGDPERIFATVRPRWIFVCAGSPAAGSAEEMHALHVRGSESLLSAVAQLVPEAVTVLFGSAAEYGQVSPALLSIREDVPPRPESAYGQSKLAQLRAGQQLAQRHSLRVHVVRPFNILGPGMGGHLVAAALCERLLHAKSEGRCGPIAVANGHATRDWVDVRDVADAVIRLAFDAPPTSGSVGLFNVASGIETPVLSLAEHLCRLAGDFQAVDAGPMGSPSGIDRSCGDASKLQAATGWQPRIPWQESAAALWESVSRYAESAERSAPASRSAPQTPRRG
jgi:GDP-4-dehydro-6-deoxy-D-mannose reductase